MTNGERVKQLRKESGLSAQKFGDKYGIPLRTVQDWEREKRSAPEYVISMLEYIARTETIALMAWVLEIYKSDGGPGIQLLFPSQMAAIEHAQEAWAKLSDEERAAYKADPAGVFAVTLRNAEWDEALGIFEAAGDAIIHVWSPLK